VSRYAKQALVTVADQGLTSATNFALTVVAARILAPEEFGRVVLILAFVYLVTAIFRALVGEPLLSMAGRGTNEQVCGKEQAAITFVVLGSIAVVLCLMLVAQLAPPDVLREASLIAPWVPAVVLQDSLRYVALSRLRPVAAFLSDCAWAFTQTVVLVSLLVLDGGTSAAVIGSWGGGALVGALVALLMLRLRPSLRVGPAIRWFTSTRRYGMWLLPQVAASSLDYQILILAAGHAFGAAVVGEYRAMQTLVMPIFVLMAAAQSILVPRLSLGLRNAAPPSVVQKSLAWCLVGAVAAGALAGLVVLISRPLIQIVYGPSFVSSSSFLLPLAVGAVLHAPSIVTSAVLRARQEGRRIFTVQLVASGYLLIAVVTASIFGTPLGLLWAIAPQGLIATVLGLAMVHRAVMSPGPGGVVPDTWGHSPPHRRTVVVLAGPDGSGKSTAADVVTARMEARGILVTRVHHRPGVIGARTVASEAVWDPHAQRPRSLVSGLPKLVLVFVDYTLAQLWVWRRVHGLLLIERGWYDMSVDPRRYRLTPALGRLAGLMGRLLPGPDLIIVLTGSAEKIHARKPEITVDEIDRQNYRWQQLVRHVGARGAVVDTTSQGTIALEEVVREVETAMDDRGKVGTWRRVPLMPYRLTMNQWGDAKGALGVYQPHRPMAKLATPVRGALVEARLGHRGSPSFDPGPLLRSLGLPTDGLICVADNRPGRMIVGIAHDGRLTHVAKIGTLDDVALRNEAATLQLLLGKSLPFAVPRIYWTGEADGRFAVVSAAVAMSHSRPAKAENVVDACSALVTGVAGQPAMTHGDLAPWNVALSDRGLVILDWESARNQYLPLYDLTFFVLRRGASLGAYGPSRAQRLLVGERSPGQRHLQQIGVDPGMAAELVVRCLDQMTSVPVGEQKYVARLRHLLV